MIIYGLLSCILYILNTLASILGTLIPNFPDIILNLLDELISIFSGGIGFISYFFYWPVVVALLSIILGFHAFKIAKDAIMKVIGHFIAN